ncbi:MAG: LysR family transcriptional regulator [Litorimonas sp.]
MIDKLKSMAIFATIVEEGTFRGAAKKLAVSPAIVSLHVKKLETQIGAPLLYRSTRRVTLTQDGEAFYESVKLMMSAAEDGLNHFSSQARTQLTELRVAIPDTLSVNPIMTKITAFAKNHTGIRLNLMSTDKRQSLIGEGHDVAIRMGYFKDSDLKSKRIGEDRRVVVASPAYLEKKADPEAPEDLLTWDFISFSLVPDHLQLKQGNDTSQNVVGNVIAKANSALSVRALCLSGMGVALLPYHLVERDLEMGRLIRVLPSWEDTKVLPIYIVWIPNADLSLATREFINFMSR